jgi:hypothetical protein
MPDEAQLEVDLASALSRVGMGKAIGAVVRVAAAVAVASEGVCAGLGKTGAVD